jgi:hypothetical protein
MSGFFPLRWNRDVFWNFLHLVLFVVASSEAQVRSRPLPIIPKAEERNGITRPSGASMTYCKQCLEKQRRINELEEEIASLKHKLRYQERTAQEGFFGSSTPSSTSTPLNHPRPTRN